MAFVLENQVFEQGLQDETALLLEALKYLATISPFTIVNVESDLNSGQPQTFSTEGLDKFLTRVYSLNLDYSALNATERTVLNVIREYLQPSPNLDCCAVGVLPDILEIDVEFNEKVGTLTFEHEIRVIFNQPFDCNIAKVQLVDWAYPGGAPQPINVPAEPTTLKLGCVNGKQTFSFLWVSFPSNPSGFNYPFELRFLDANDVQIGSDEPFNYVFP